jgi:thioredoxin reductase
VSAGGGVGPAPGVDGRVRHDVDVLVVGAGPAGLAAATALRQAGIARVEVLERESRAGGVPRHCAHLGFGIRDLRRVLSGPAYAQRWVERAEAAGARIRTSAMVTGWTADGGLEISSPEGVQAAYASAVLLATGARERPRTARWVPGDRAEGVFTTGHLQQAVHLHHQPIGQTAVVVGAEHVSFSAVTTLRHAGVRVAGLVTEHPRHQSYAAFRLGARLLFDASVITGTRVVEVRGRPRVQEVVLERLRDGRRWSVACDTVVFTGDWIPDHELVRLRTLRLDQATLGPTADACGMTSSDGVFAAGNLCHPVETADVAALTGRHVGTAVATWLRQRSEVRTRAAVPIEADPVLSWVWPQAVRSTSDVPARGGLLVRPLTFARLPRIEVTQGGRVLWSGRVARFVPTRSARIPVSWLPKVDLEGPPLRVGTDAVSG